MRTSLCLSLIAALLLPPPIEGQDGEHVEILDWDRLPDLPGELGVAGPFAGVSAGALIVAGGANFPVPLWKEGRRNPDARKVWHDDLYVLLSPEAEWRKSDSLPRPLAYGASVSDTSPEASLGVICIGGGDESFHYREVFTIQWVEGFITHRTLPELPATCAFTSAAIVDDTLYVAGGRETPNSPTVMKNFWSLDLAAARDRSRTGVRWRELPPWPGPARMLAVAGAQEGSFFLVSGVELVEDEAGGVKRRYLTDGYRYTPGGGVHARPADDAADDPSGDAAPPGTWTRIADTPVAVAAAPSPAPSVGTSHLLVLGGDDGRLAEQNDELADEHPGFSRHVLAYHTITDTWTRLGELPAAHVTTTVVDWSRELDGKREWIVPSGEVAPGIRSPAVLSATPRKPKAGFAVLDYVAVVLYLVTLMGMGVYFARRETSTSRFFLADRSIPWWAAGLSIFGTQLSAITFMAIPALVYRTNWVYFLGNMCIVLSAPVFVWYYLPFFRRLRVTTAYEYLEKRFSFLLRLLGSLSFILLQLGRMGIVLYLPSLALSTATGIDIYVSIAVMGCLATLYTVLGGIEAVIWTDVLQVLVLLGGALLSLGLIVGQVEGGFGGIISMGAAAEKFKAVNLSWDFATTALWVVLIGRFLEQFVPYTSDQTVVQRYLTTKDERAAARSIWTNAVLTIPASIVFFGLGTALWAFYTTHPELLNAFGRSDDIFPWFIAHELPVGVSGVVIAGLFAASMSSMDSSMNSIATVITTDVYRRMASCHPDRHYLTVARWLTVMVGVVGTGFGLYMAVVESTSMWDQYTKVLGLFGGGLAGLFALGIFTRSAHSGGALIGLLVSAFVLYEVREAGVIHFFLYTAIGMATCFFVGLVASTVLPGHNKSVEGLTIHTIDRNTGGS